MSTERRKGGVVVFERPINVHLMAIDGTWRRSCAMTDVSEKSASLVVEGSLEGLNLTEFFLLLSSTGLAYRRCQLEWVKADRVGVSFIKQTQNQKAPAKYNPEATVP